MARSSSSLSIWRAFVGITAVFILSTFVFQKNLIGAIASIRPVKPISSDLLPETRILHKFSQAIDGGWASRPLTNKGGFLWVQYNETYRVTWGVTVFHALHCIEMLRIYTLNDSTIYAHEAPGDIAPANMDQSVHMSHCLDYISQAILCSADDTLEPPVLEFDKSGNVIQQVVAGHGYEHSCKNTDYLWDIVEASEEKPFSPWDWKNGDTVSSVFRPDGAP